MKMLRVHRIRAAKGFLGISRYPISEPWVKKLALGLIKVWMVSARERGLDGFAAELSQMKKLFEQKQCSRCEVCGQPIREDNATGRCVTHRKYLRCMRRNRICGVAAAMVMAVMVMGSSGDDLSTNINASVRRFSIQHRSKEITKAPMPPAPAELQVLSVANVIVRKPQYADVALAWTGNTDPSVVGYNLYYGLASRTYTNMVNVGNATLGYASNLVVGVTYYFAVTDYNAAGLESDYSAELVYTVPKPPTRPETNVVTVTGTNISSGPTLNGPWTRLTPTNGTSFSLTNPTPSQEYFRGLGIVRVRRVTI